MIGVPQDGDAGYSGHGVLEQLDGFSGQAVVNIGGAGDIAARSSDARDEPAGDRIVAHDHHDRN
jgi:hypothetical protein